MTALKDQCHLALPDVDPSIALALAARRDFERPTAHQLIKQAKRDRAQYTAALLRRFARYTAALLLHFVARLRSTFQISISVTASTRGRVGRRPMPS